MRQSSYAGGKIGIGTMVAKRSIIRLTAAFLENVVDKWPAFTGSPFISMITAGERTLKDFNLPIDQSQDRHRLNQDGHGSTQPEGADWQLSERTHLRAVRRNSLDRCTDLPCLTGHKERESLRYNFFIMAGFTIVPQFQKAVGDPARLLFLARIRLWENVVSTWLAFTGSRLQPGRLTSAHRSTGVARPESGAHAFF